MTTPKMHADEVTIDAALVRRLLARQLPAWANSTISPVSSDGIDNALYRLGETMVVRLPRHPQAVPQLEKEHRWLPVLAPHLPLSIPVPLATGVADESYP